MPVRRPPPKPGKICFNLEGAKSTIAAAQAKVQAEEAVAALKARRANTRDASTQTVRDPEREGDIVALWRLRPKGMEAPKPPKKRSRDVTAVAAVAAEDEAAARKASSAERRERKKARRAEGAGATNGTSAPAAAMTSAAVRAAAPTR